MAIALSSLLCGASPPSRVFGSQFFRHTSELPQRSLQVFDDLGGDHVRRRTVMVLVAQLSDEGGSSRQDLKNCVRFPGLRDRARWDSQRRGGPKGKGGGRRGETRSTKAATISAPPWPNAWRRNGRYRKQPFK